MEHVLIDKNKIKDYFTKITVRYIISSILFAIVLSIVKAIPMIISFSLIFTLLILKFRRANTMFVGYALYEDHVRILFVWFKRLNDISISYSNISKIKYDNRFTPYITIHTSNGDIKKIFFNTQFWTTKEADDFFHKIEKKMGNNNSL